MASYVPSQIADLQGLLQQLTQSQLGLGYPRQQSAEAPTLALSASGAATAIAGGVTYFPWDRTNGRLYPHFGYAGGRVVQAGYAVPDRDYVRVYVANTSVVSAPFVAEFFIDSADFELIHKGLAARLSIYVDGVRVLHTNSADRTGTLQAGGVNTATLDAGASATSGIYVGNDLVITGGTGAGQQKPITAYNGTTKVATVASAWSVQPDNTSTFEIRAAPGQALSTPGLTGGVYRVRCTFASRAVRRIRVETNGYFSGLTCGPTDALWAANPAVGPVCIGIGDSYLEPTGAQGSRSGWFDVLCNLMGWHGVAFGAGGTGYINEGTTAGKVRYVDRAAPDVNTFMVDRKAPTGGTYTISVTVGGVTQTTAPLAYNTSLTALQTALEGLANVGSGNVQTYGTFQTRILICFRGALASAAGVSLTMDGTLLTGGGTGPSAFRWAGEIADNQPVDGQGRALPFFIVLAGGYNDTASTSAAIDAAFRLLVSRLQSRFPQATLLVVGPWAPSATISSGNVATQATLATAAAAVLRRINGNVPYVNVHGFITGTGKQGTETGTGSADRYTGPDGAHPSEAGHEGIGGFVAGEFGRVLGLQVQQGSGWLGE